MLVTQARFGPEFLEYFAVVDGDSQSVCGRAAKRCAQTVVADVRSDPGFAPHREIAAAAGFRAVQSTPLTDYAGSLIGVVSTHFRHPHRPSDRDLRLMELYADFAGEAVTRHLGASSDPGDRAGRGVITVLARSLAAPGRQRVGPVRAVGHGPADREPSPAAAPGADRKPKTGELIAAACLYVGARIRRP